MDKRLVIIILTIYVNVLGDELRFPNEHKIDNANQTPEETTSKIVQILKV